MANVLLSADGDCKVYSVPAIVANNLEEYCINFARDWLHTSPDAEKYRTSNGAVCYNEEDFIDYLNKWIFPKQQSLFIENLGLIDSQYDIPRRYKECPWFNF